jgi:hypothetical protein
MTATKAETSPLKVGYHTDYVWLVSCVAAMGGHSSLCLKETGKRVKAKKMFRDLLSHARKLQKATAKIDYFATLLPAILLFADDLRFRQETTALFLQAQAHLGLGKKKTAEALLWVILERDPNHALASELLEEIKRQKDVVAG